MNLGGSLRWPVRSTLNSDTPQAPSKIQHSVSEADVQVQLALLSHNVRALLRYEQYHGKFMKLPIIQLIHVLHPGKQLKHSLTREDLTNFSFEARSSHDEGLPP